MEKQNKTKKILQLQKVLVTLQNAIKGSKNWQIPCEQILKVMLVDFKKILPPSFCYFILKPLMDRRKDFQIFTIFSRFLIYMLICYQAFKKNSYVQSFDSLFSFKAVSSAIQPISVILIERVKFLNSKISRSVFN